MSIKFRAKPECWTDTQESKSQALDSRTFLFFRSSSAPTISVDTGNPTGKIATQILDNEPVCLITVSPLPTTRCWGFHSPAAQLVVRGISHSRLKFC